MNDGFHSNTAARTERRKTSSARLLWLLWLVASALFMALSFYPVSTRLTRGGGLALLAVVWFGLIGLCWRRRGWRFLLLGLTALAMGFLVWPERGLPAADLLRGDFVAGMRRYKGARYVWGGEGIKGIDCSGLIRRGLVDAMFLRGVRTL